MCVLADWLACQQIEHIRGGPYHPPIQGEIKRWYQTLKNRILLEHSYPPGEFETRIESFVDH